MEIRALTAEDLPAWSRFRYRVAIEQLRRRSMPGVDHEAQAIGDALDVNAHAFGAFDGLRLIGGVRSHYCRDVPEHPLYALYRLEDVSEEERLATSVTTHLMVDQEWKGRGVALALCTHMYNYNVGNGIEYDRIDVLATNRPLFERMGYEATGPAVERDGFGTVLPMRLEACNLAHLKKCRSPFRRRYGNTHSSSYIRSSSSATAPSSFTLRQAGTVVDRKMAERTKQSS
ncbi:MAG: GNAT family N-acetyltransferase [Planctomycetota bacterium]